ncbi:FAS1 domain-containing protein [Aspergillus aurantiobrunneus]
MRFFTSAHYLLGLLSLFPPPILAQDTSSSTSSPTSTSISTESPSSPPLPDAASPHGGGRWGNAISNELPPGARGRRTAFVPSDDSFPSRAVRQAGYGAEQYLYQVSDQLLTAASLRAFAGSIIESLDSDANLGGRGQAVLSHGQRDTAVDACSNTTAPIRLYSGLGNNVTILEEDIPFDGGILHIISGPFTRPTALSESLRSTSQASSFTQYISSHLPSLDSTASITVFVPANDGLTATLGSNATISEAEITALVDGHVVSGVVAYSPLLISGARFQTLDRQEIVVTADANGDILLNDAARVVRSDIVIGNGVVHLIDQPLSTPGNNSVTGTGADSGNPTSTTTGDGALFTGAGGWATTRASQTGDSTWNILFGLAVAFVSSTAYF